MSVQVPNGVVDVAVADEAEAVAVAKQYLVVLPGAASPTGSAPTSGCCVASIPENRLRVYDVRNGDRDAGRHRLGARAAARRSASAWSPRSSASRAGRSGVIANNPMHLARRDRQRRRRQGGALHAAVRRLRPPDPVPLRHARDHGRARGREDRAGAPLQPACSSIGGQPDRAVLHDRAAQGLRPRRPGDGGRQLQGAGLHGRLADRRVRRHGPRGRGEARLPQRARRDRGPGRARARSSTRWSPGCTSTARRSTPPPTSRSTTSSTRRVADPGRRGAPRLAAPAGPRPARSARASTPGEIPLYWR